MKFTRFLEKTISRYFQYRLDKILSRFKFVNEIDKHKAQYEYTIDIDFWYHWNWYSVSGLKRLIPFSNYRRACGVSRHRTIKKQYKFYTKYKSHRALRIIKKMAFILNGRQNRNWSSISKTKKIHETYYFSVSLNTQRINRNVIYNNMTEPYNKVCAPILSFFCPGDNVWVQYIPCIDFRSKNENDILAREQMVEHFGIDEKWYRRKLKEKTLLDKVRHQDFIK